MQIDVIKRAIELVPEVKVYLSEQVLDMLTKRVPPKQSEKNTMERKLTALMNKRFKWEAEHISNKLQSYFPERKGWVTINGNHVLIGEEDYRGLGGFKSPALRAKKIVNKYLEMFPDHTNKSEIERLNKSIDSIVNIDNKEWDSILAEYAAEAPEITMEEMVDGQEELFNRLLVGSMPLNLIDEYNIPITDEQRMIIIREAFMGYQQNDSFGVDMNNNAEYLTGMRDEPFYNFESFPGDHSINLNMQKESADLLQGIITSPDRDVEAWRGSKALDISVGDVIEDPLMSFTTDKEIALNKFGANNYFGPTNTIIHISGDSKGFLVEEDFPSMIDKFGLGAEMEYLTGGKFKVDSIREENGFTIIDVSQVAIPRIVR